MSNLIVNIRFGSWHLQVLQFCDWRHHWPITFSRNQAHDFLREDDPNWRWFEVYQP